MKQNLVFTGLGGETKNENTGSKLRHFLYHEIGIDSDIQFWNVYKFADLIKKK